MKSLRRLLDKVAQHFDAGGRYHRYSALYEMIDTLLYTPKTVTTGSLHVRDAIELKRVMIFVVLAAIPSVLAGVWNTGYQTNVALVEVGLNSLPGWRNWVLSSLGAGHDPSSVYDCVILGALYFLPIYIVTLLVGGLWETLFALVRGHEVNEGFLVTSLLFALIVPPGLPWWQVAIGISFGVVIGKEVFGGTGKNIINPALAGRVFLYFAYPAYMSGDAVWVAVDGYSGATPLALAAVEGVNGITLNGMSWSDSFLGAIPGSLGETSTLAILLGALFLIVTGVASWRIMTGVFFGMLLTVLLFNVAGDPGNGMAMMPWYWHLVLGGFAFGMVFMATDPVTAAQTQTGRWLFGILIGVLTVLIRIANPAYPEGIMMAIILANLIAPLIDQGVVQWNLYQKKKRYG